MTRSAEPALDLEALSAFFDAHGIGRGPTLVADQIGDGRSNLTFRIRRGEERFVLRRPPRGPLPPKAHDVLREARVLDGLAASDVPVPRVLATSSDPGIIGASFVVTEWLDGRVLSARSSADDDQHDTHRAMSRSLVDVLATIHDVDYGATTLAKLGRPDGYVERQVKLHLALWERYRTEDVPAIEEVGRWLLANLPPSPRPALVHGDYRLGNAMFTRAEPNRILAMLDWELATIGDPMVDLGYLCACWTEEGDPPDSPWQPDPATRAPGFATRAQLVAWYEARRPGAVHDLAWYRTLAIWRGAIFMQGNHLRAVRGTTVDPHLLAIGPQIPLIAELAHASTRAD